MDCHAGAAARPRRGHRTTSASAEDLIAGRTCSPRRPLPWKFDIMLATQNIRLRTAAAILSAPAPQPAFAEGTTVIAQAPAPAPAPGDVDPRAPKKEPGAR